MRRKLLKVLLSLLAVLMCLLPTPSHALDPSSVTGLQCWYKGDAVTGLSDGATMVTWPDSSGNAWTLSASARAPVWKTSTLNGHAVVRFSNSGGNQTMTMATGPDLSAAGYTVMVVMVPLKYISNPQAMWLAANGVQGSQNFCLSAGGSGFSRFNGSGLGPGIVYGQPYIAIYQFAPNAGASGADVETIRRNGQYICKDTSTLTAWDNTKPWYIGGRGASDAFGWTGDIADIAVYNRVISESDCQLLENYANSQYAITTRGVLDSSTQVVFDGNSLTCGYQIPATSPNASQEIFSFPEQAFVRVQQFATYRTWNTAHIGEQTTQMTTRASAYVDTRLSDGYSRNILVANETINNVISGTRTAAQNYSDWKTYVQARKTAGWNTIVWIGAGSMGTAPQDAIRVSAEALIKADFTIATNSPLVWKATPGVNTWCDYYVDLSNSPDMGPIGSNGWTVIGGMYTDALHPNAGGQSAIASLLTVALGNVINPPPASTIQLRAGQLPRARK